MPNRDVAPPGAPSWVDLFTTDQDASRAFYSELFGWTVVDPGPDYGGYINFLSGGVQVAGCMHNHGDTGQPDMWSVYLAVDDAQKTVDAAVAHGGQVIVPAMAVMDLGTMAVVTDVGGAAIGMWQAGLHTGFGLVGEPGAPSWFELQARDYDATVAFYRDVFHWNTNVMSDTAEFRYTTLAVGDENMAGIMDASTFLPDAVPANWSVYFGVADTDAALAKVVELGGTVVVEAQDSPYGRLATASDSTGAMFRIVAGM